MEDPQLPPRPAQPADDHLLEELAALTGLFNPERIWQEEEILDDMEQQETPPSTKPTEPT
ncbi:MAG: hypothetical protein ACRYFZ_26215 [Janthinobacterium lividum]